MRGRSRAFVVLGVLVAIGCGPPPRRGSGDDDGAGDAQVGGGGDGANGDCADGTELVYTIDEFANKLSRFDPSTKTFTDLGQLSCPTMAGATPFSMGVARDGVAWVLYNSGELFKVVLPGLACTKTLWSSPNNMHVFGMGFSTDDVGGSTEHLFIGGGASQTQSSFTLAMVDTQQLTAQPIGQQPALPEMTGNANAELWGFFADASMPSVVQFDKTAGTIIKSFPQPTLAGTNAGYAFAHWGGDYWVFLIKNGEAASSVYQVDGMTGAIKSTTLASGRTIVGAGVSTCAPVVVF